MSGEHVRVLLIEDNAWDARVIRAHLRKADPEAVVEVAGTLAQGEAGAIHRPDVVVCDLNLPDSAGWATLESVRARMPQVPVVVLTGGPVSYAEAYAKGATDFLAKDQLSAEAIGRAIRHALARHRPQADVASGGSNAIVTFDDFPCMVALVDASGALERWNAAFARVAGYTHSELMGKPLADLLLPDPSEPKLLARDGAHVPVAWHERPLRDVRGNVCGRLVVAHALPPAGSLAGALVRQLARVLPDVTGHLGTLRNASDPWGPAEGRLASDVRALRDLETLAADAADLLALGRLERAAGERDLAPMLRAIAERFQAAARARGIQLAVTTEGPLPTPRATAAAAFVERLVEDALRQPTLEGDIRVLARTTEGAIEVGFEAPGSLAAAGSASFLEHRGCSIDRRGAPGSVRLRLPGGSP